MKQSYYGFKVLDKVIVIETIKENGKVIANVGNILIIQSFAPYVYKVNSFDYFVVCRDSENKIVCCVVNQIKQIK